MEPNLNLDRRSFLLSASGGLAAVAILPELGFATPAPRLADPIGVGVIGVGRHGRALLDELQKIEAFKVAAVCDTEPARLSGGQRRAAGAEGFTTHQEMLDKAKGVQAVVIATPTHLHKEIALDCLSAGKHVFCEAPLAATVEDCKAIAAAAAKASTIFQPGLYARSNPVYKLARTFFKSDSVLELIAMRAQDYKKQSWRFPSSDPARDNAANWRLDPAVSIGLAGELGTHQFDVFQYYTGRYAKGVRGDGSIRLHNDGRTIADTIHCDFHYADGVMLSYSASICNSYEGRYEVFHGSNAAIKLAWSHGWMFKEADSPTQGWEVYANRQQFHNDEGITLIADATKLASQGKLKEGIGLPFTPAYYALVDFAGSIADKKPPACSAAEGARASIIGILANQAVVGRKEIDITEDALKI
ncbi:MAG: Gfo/Idh/MocA family oxidoreductase [Phycisphaerae bacterium]|nr:Gfo/Idh/MocA family oxidoreductase [Phycisphaerae bacterium]